MNPYGLLEEIKKHSPDAFENLVLQFLLKMENCEHGQVLGGIGDEGVDGFIRLDNLGLGDIYFQAKRWDETTIGRPEIQKFVGALHGKRASRGVFVTTSTFTNEAKTYVENLDIKVRIIDGFELAELILKNKSEHLILNPTTGSSPAADSPSSEINEVIMKGSSSLKKDIKYVGSHSKEFYEKISSSKFNTLFEAYEKHWVALFESNPEKCFLVFDINTLNFIARTTSRKEAIYYLSDFVNDRVLIWRDLT